MPRTRSLSLPAALLVVGALGCATVGPPPPPASPERTWGIEVVGVRRSAADYLLDFRYRVIDPQRAAALMDRKVRPFLLDQASGAKLFVPSPPKVGPLRASGALPQAGRTYFVLFANPGRLVKKGNQVTVTIGELELRDLTVQ